MQRSKYLNNKGFYKVFFESNLKNLVLEHFWLKNRKSNSI